MKKLKFIAAGMTDVGVKKKTNEDAFTYRIVKIDDNYSGVFAVADGVGGLEKGEVASYTAITGINSWWEQEICRHYYDKEVLVRSLLKKLGELNNEIIELSDRYSVRMATTLSVLLLHQENFIIAHVGDSRIYRVSGTFQSSITQITKDHSCFVERQINGQTIKKSVLTQWLGNKEKFKYYTDLSPIKKNDIFIVCSDGIYKRLSEEQILKTVKSSKNDMKLLCKTLIEMAKQSGEIDNISAIAVRIQA